MISGYNRNGSRPSFFLGGQGANLIWTCWRSTIELVETSFYFPNAQAEEHLGKKAFRSPTSSRRFSFQPRRKNLGA
jgi:hypothetical protein